MKKKFKIQIDPKATGQTLEQALKLAETTGVLTVPDDAAFLQVAGGRIQEVKSNV